MGNDLFSYVQRLEVLAFFSGFPLLWLIITAWAGQAAERKEWKNQLIKNLPFTYGITGILFLGYLLKNLYPDYSISHLLTSFQNPFFTIWGLTAIFFLVPVLRSKSIFSLLHSLVFLALIVRDFIVQLTSANPENDILKNDMRVYFDSLLLVSGVFLVTFILRLIIRHAR
jgi:hypothetical protein